MPEEKKQKKEGCPLCNVSEQTLEQLKKSQPEKPKIKKPIWKIWSN